MTVSSSITGSGGWVLVGEGEAGGSGTFVGAGAAAPPPRNISNPANPTKARVKTPKIVKIRGNAMSFITSYSHLHS
jgi:hypothetical protein